jgi:hypothetical protein
MKRHNLDSNRDIKRRVEERRRHSRRIITHAFASAEWIKVVQSSYTFWPREDRRDQQRRSVSRRMAERRIQSQQYYQRALRKQPLQQHVKSQLLTTEEKSMLNKLNSHH